MAKKSKSKSKSKSINRSLNALEIAEKELGNQNSDNDDKQYNSRRNGTVVNLLKKVKNQDRGNANDYDDSEDFSENDSFEDEELDSDEALGTDDEFDVLNSKISQTVRDRKENGASYTSDIDVDDLDEGGYTSIEEENLMPLSQIWDVDSKPYKVGADSDNDNGPKLNLQDDLSSGISESSSESESESDEKDENPFDEISDDDEDIELKTITSNLIKSSNKHTSKRLATYGVGEENEFILPSISENKGNQKLSLADMMNIVDDKEVIEKATLIKGDDSTAAVPLPLRIQQRNERQAAYELSKDEVNKWSDTVKQNRRAEHLSFPLNPKTEHNHASAFTRTTNADVQSELQEKVDKVLQASNLVDPQKESTFEELTTAETTPDELRKRTIEMRLMRELMFREERKSRRLKKIKSKTYHRIKKKEVLRNKELAGVDDDESDTDRDIARAKERMTLKHKTNSKWAKDMIKHGMTNDAETREEMEEMLKQGERLKSKIMDRNSEDEDNGKNLSDFEKEYTNESDSDDVKASLGKTGVMNMAFMKNAESREKEANKEAVSRLRAMEDDGDIIDSDNEVETNGETIQLNKGRRIYTPSNLKAQEELEKVNKLANEEQEIDESRGLANRLKKANNKYNTQVKILEDRTKDNSEDASNKATTEPENPWLVNSDDESHKNIKRSSKITIVDKDSSKESKAIQKIEKEAAKQNKKLKKNSSNQNDDLLLDSEVSNKLNIVDPYGGSDDDEGHEFMFKQQDVIAEAFAGDNVVAEFSQEKKRVAEDEDDKEEDVTLPGWGDWAGTGSVQKKKRKFIKKIKGVVEMNKRKDKHLKNVIINERVNKKNLKYQSSDVPFPFENREQYERSLRMPIGQEWTSRQSHQKLIKPRIMTKPGEVIDPLKAPFK